VTFDVMMLDVVWVASSRARGGCSTSRLGAARRAGAALPSTLRPARGTARVWAMPWLMNVGVLLLPHRPAREVSAWPRRDLGGARRPGRARARAERESKTGRRSSAGPAVRGAHRQRAGGDLGNGARVSAPTAPLPGDRARGGGLSFLRAADRLRREPVVGDRGDGLSRRHFGDGRAIFLRNCPTR